MDRNDRLKRIRDLEVIRAMCADGALLTSECAAAPVFDRRRPPAGPGRGGGRPEAATGRRDPSGDTPPGAFLRN